MVLELSYTVSFLTYVHAGNSIMPEHLVSCSLPCTGLRPVKDPVLYVVERGPEGFERQECKVDVATLANGVSVSRACLSGRKQARQVEYKRSMVLRHTQTIESMSQYISLRFVSR